MEDIKADEGGVVFAYEGRISGPAFGRTAETGAISTRRYWHLICFRMAAYEYAFERRSNRHPTCTHSSSHERRRGRERTAFGHRERNVGARRPGARSGEAE